MVTIKTFSPIQIILIFCGLSIGFDIISRFINSDFKLSAISNSLFLIQELLPNILMLFAASVGTYFTTRNLGEPSLGISIAKVAIFSIMFTLAGTFYIILTSLNLSDFGLRYGSYLYRFIPVGLPKGVFYMFVFLHFIPRTSLTSKELNNPRPIHEIVKPDDVID